MHYLIRSVKELLDGASIDLSSISAITPRRTAPFKGRGRQRRDPSADLTGEGGGRSTLASGNRLNDARWKSNGRNRIPRGRGRPGTRGGIYRRGASSRG